MVAGIVLCALGVFHGGLKYLVLRDVARDPYNGAGVPTLDFLLFVPVWFSVGGTWLLQHYGLYPFPYFGLVLFAALVLVFGGVMQLEFSLGRPERERELQRLKEKSGER